MRFEGLGSLVEGFQGFGFWALRVFRIEGAKAEEFRDLGFSGFLFGGCCNLHNKDNTHSYILVI